MSGGAKSGDVGTVLVASQGWVFGSSSICANTEPADQAIISIAIKATVRIVVIRLIVRHLLSHILLGALLRQWPLVANLSMAVT